MRFYTAKNRHGNYDCEKHLVSKIENEIKSRVLQRTTHMFVCRYAFRCIIHKLSADPQIDINILRETQFQTLFANLPYSRLHSLVALKFCEF